GGSAGGAGGAGGSIAGIIGGLFGKHHNGGIAGSPTQFSSVSPAVFAGAMRYHTGGLAGLQPDEVPAILRKGEEILTKSDGRHLARSRCCSRSATRSACSSTSGCTASAQMSSCCRCGTTAPN